MELATSDGGGGDRAVVLLHGQPGSGADLGALASALASRMRVIVPDRPGYGRTGGEAVGFRENARRLLALLDRLGLRSATLAGHSWGAGVVLAAAELAPERADALVLISPVSPTRGLGRLDRALADPAIGPPLLRAGFGLVGHSLALRPLRRLAAAVLPGLRYDDVLATAVQWRTAPVWRSFFVEQRALVDELPSLAPALAFMDLPATVLTGTRDRIASPAAAGELARALPRGSLVTVPGVGHLLPQQRPLLVAQAIQALGHLGTRHQRQSQADGRRA